jgi:hypothetical protein
LHITLFAFSAIAAADAARMLHIFDTPPIFIFRAPEPAAFAAIITPITLPPPPHDAATLIALLQPMSRHYFRFTPLIRHCRHAAIFHITH